MSVSTQTVSRPSLKWRAAGAGRTMTTFFSVFTWTHTHTHTLPVSLHHDLTLLSFSKSHRDPNHSENFSPEPFFCLCPARFRSVCPPPPTLPVLHYKSSWHNWTATKKPTKNKNKKATTSESFLLVTVQLQTDEREKRGNTSLTQQHIQNNTMKSVWFMTDYLIIFNPL